MWRHQLHQWGNPHGGVCHCLASDMRRDQAKDPGHLIVTPAVSCLTVSQLDCQRKLLAIRIRVTLLIIYIF